MAVRQHLDNENPEWNQDGLFNSEKKETHSEAIYIEPANG